MRSARCGRSLATGPRPTGALGPAVASRTMCASFRNIRRQKAFGRARPAKGIRDGRQPTTAGTGNRPSTPGSRCCARHQGRRCSRCVDNSVAAMTVAAWGRGGRRADHGSGSGRRHKRVCPSTGQQDVGSQDGNGRVEILGSPYYKGVPLPRIPSVRKIHRVAKYVFPCGPLSPRGNTVDPLEQHNMHPRFGFREAGQY